MRKRLTKWTNEMKIFIFCILQLFSLIQISQCINSDFRDIPDHPDNPDFPDVTLHYNDETKEIELKDYLNYRLVRANCTNIDDEHPGITKMPCKNLLACTEYIVKAIVENLRTNETHVQNTVIETPYKMPLLSLFNVIPFNDSITLIWSASNKKCILEYLVQQLFSHETTKLGRTVEFFTISNLEPCRNYNFNFRLIDINNELLRNDNINKSTEYSDPGPVKPITIKKSGKNSMLVTWTPPEHVSCAKYYHLKWTKLQCLSEDEKKCIWEQRNISLTDGTEYNIQNISGCLDYQIRILVNGEDESSSRKNFSSEFQVPGPIQNLTEIKKTSTYFTIKWDPPEMTENCVQKYKIILTGPRILQTGEILYTNLTEFTKSNLEACGEYNVSVQSIGILGDSSASNLTIKMEQDIPTAVRNATAFTYPHELFIIYSPPKFAELCVKEYVITAWHYDSSGKPIEAFSENTRNTTVTINQLIACMEYTIQIIPATRNQATHGEPVQIKYETKPTPMDKPNDLEKTAFSESLILKTSPVYDKNNCELLNARFSCSAVESKAKVQYAEIDVDLSNSNKQFITANVKPLSPYTKYRCEAAIYNIAGWGKSTVALFDTSTYFPELPESVRVEDLSNTSFRVKWEPPQYANGQMTVYKIYIQMIRTKYKTPSYCTELQLKNHTTIVEHSKLQYDFKDAMPHTEYSIQIAASNDFGSGKYSNPVVVLTNSWVSDPVFNFSVYTVGPDLSDTYRASSVLEWYLPCRANGNIIKFEGEFFGYRRGYENRTFSWSMEVNRDAILATDIFQWEEFQLEPEYNYTVTIVVIIDGIEIPSEMRTANFISPAGIPPLVDTSTIVEVSPFATNNPTISAMVKFPRKILDSKVGTVLYVAFLLSEKDCQEDPMSEFELLDSTKDWPNATSWHEAHDMPCIIQYQTTPLRWSPGKLYGSRQTNVYNDFIEYTIGTEDCEVNSKYCNGPLKPDTTYNLVLRLFTKSGFSDTAKLTFKTDSLVKIFLLLVLVICCLLIAFLLGFVYLWATKKIIWRNQSIHGVEEQSGDISTKNFLEFYDELSRREKLQREFKELAAITNDLNFPNTASKSNENKNRYSNIFPYDKNRVILDCDSDGSDYINASFINGYKHRKEYIATQGPKPESFTDFWKMIIQHNVHVIVMVTQLMEGVTMKCHQYFPVLHQERKFGNNINVSCVRETCLESCNRRELRIEHVGDGIRRTVIHYHFKKWPDHDCPSDPSDLINFIRQVKSEKIPSHSPITVHCSAGVGRTGTFIALDIIAQRLKLENKINIFETVKELRFQRMKMVQAIQQYQFLYNCVFQIVKQKRPTALCKKRCKKDEIEPSNELPDQIPKRQSFNPNDIESVM